ncbi:S-methyl thiohydantoin desulfurase domain-containing protein [Pimelobacter simplex]|uniref:S-methyl thiohydantoin desulfurase domain-containing protein n=1 Tax=Nocardioides simplex TaxID=2045 RepID=UPI001933A375|nr:DUF917 domain-containing protein [Pimelobacter simplex]
MSHVDAVPLGLIAEEHVDALAAGATLLGSGGGGNVALAEQLVRHAVRRRPVVVRRADELAPDAHVVHVGVVGAPDVLAERLVDPHDMAVAAHAVAAQTGGRLDAVGIIEIGGLNGLAGVVAAAELGLPVVDGDLMGRAFPSINKTTMALAGGSAAPLSVVGPVGDTVVVTRSSAAAAERLLLTTAGAFGGAGALALYPTSAAKLTEVGIAGTLSACVALGSAFAGCPARQGAELAASLGGTFLFEGRVDEIRPRDGVLTGSITVTDRATGSAARVDLLEEFLAVTVDGITRACTPDVVVGIDPTSGVVLSSGQVRPGQMLSLLSLPALHHWPASAMGVVGPRAFGLDLELEGVLR